MWFDSYLVEKDGAGKVFDAIGAKTFWGNWMPEGITMRECFLGEYPDFKAYKDITENYDDWTDKIDSKARLPAKILPTEVTYTRNTSDNSIDQDYAIRIPNKEIITRMNLKHNTTGQYFIENELVFFENYILESNFPNGLIAHKKHLLKFLTKNNFTLFWKIIIEKTEIGGNDHSRNFKPKEISLLIMLESNGTLKWISKIEN